MRCKRAQLFASVCLLTLCAAGPHGAAQEKQATAQAESSHEASASAEAQPRAKPKPPAKPKPAAAAKQGAAPADGTFKILEFKINPGRVVKGAPYSATSVTQSVLTLADGNQIIQKREATYYRDGEGRVRVEQRFDAIGKWTAAGEPPQLITIFDPVAGHSYNLDPRRRTAVRTRLEESIASQKMTESEAKWAESQAKSAQQKRKKQEASDDDPASETLEGARAPVKKKGEPLGVRMIEGVEAEGTRLKRTIPAGEVGNTLPIDIIDESWYSPALQTQVMTIHSDPRSGVVTWRLTNIKRAEPDQTLFEVPAGYTVIEKHSSKMHYKSSEKGVSPKRTRDERPERPARNDP